jgi:CRP-like cAMP-binding protein
MAARALLQQALAAGRVTLSDDKEMLIAARRQFLSGGAILGGVPKCVIDSWQRSAAHGLYAPAQPSVKLLSRGQLRHALDRNEALVRAAWGEVETLCRDIEASGGLVILTDPDGVILMRLGSTAFAEEADRMMLRLGVNWGEHEIGTNAIGMALFERREVLVIGAEHFHESHGRLSCTATPILGPQGVLVGVLDLASAADVPHSYTLALMRRAVGQIERRLFEREFGCHEQMHFHSNPYLLGSPHEGLLAFDGSRLLGANRNALNMLGLSWSAVGNLRFDQLFSVQSPSVQRNAASDECLVQTTQGATLFARLCPPSNSAAVSPDVDARVFCDETPAAPPRAKQPLENETAPQAHEILERLLNGPSAKRLNFRKAKTGRLIYGAEEFDKRGECFLIVRSGLLRCFVSFEGKELTLFNLRAGDAIVLHPQSMLQVKADCEFVMLPQSEFRQLAKDDPELSLSALPAIERMLQKSIRMIEEIAFHGIKSRLARTLWEMADREGRRSKQGVVIDIAPSGEDLAMQIGATRQSVSTVMAGLIRTNVIQRIGNSSIVIPSLDRLKAEIEADIPHGRKSNV